ncbi:MAG: TrbI/VirB10 family protein, partial [Caulobacterales bacterium]
MSETGAPAVPSPEETVRIRAKPPQPKRLSRKVLLAGACTAGLVVALALLIGLSDRSDRRGARAEEAPASTPSAPEAIRSLPSRYDSTTLAPRAADGDEPRDMLWGEHGPPEGYEDRLAPPEDAFWAEPPPPQRYAATAPARDTEQAPDPATAPIFFTPRRDGGRAASIAAQIGETDQAIEGGGRREGFMARQGGSADVLDSPYIPARSPFALQAGAVIPAALVTALNSELPGRVIAQVTAPVYDSVSGDYLLIPQGARLIGTYDSANVYGDDRLFLVWNRIIMPNGWSLQLAGMEATDPTGAAGLSDRTDNHLDRL